MPIRTINIKEDMPTADVALRRLNMALSLAKNQGDKAIKIIHGYGSSGQGGIIRTQTRRYLAEQKAKGRLREVILGEGFSIFNEAALRALTHCPELRSDSDLDRENRGVTIVLL